MCTGVEIREEGEISIQIKIVYRLQEGGEIYGEALFNERVMSWHPYLGSSL
jgi:hypothetical protein